MLPPFDLKSWVDENREVLRPPVGNKCIYEDPEFIIMAVGGPNKRADFHINESSEFFYQIEGDIVLKVREKAKVRDVVIKQGEIFLLPGLVPHSPQRPEGTVGLVIERKRREGEQDGFIWYCENCGAKVYDHFFHLTDIEKQLPPIFAEFYDNPANSTCPKCEHRQKRNPS